MTLEQNESRKILFVATDLSTGGGVNKVIRDLAVLFIERLGASVAVVSARSSRQSSYKFPAEVPVDYHPKQSLPGYFALLLRLRRSRPDVVIGSWTQDNILIVLAFLFSGSKTVLIEHAPWHFHGWFIRLLRRLTYQLASQIIVLNPAELAHYGRYLANVRLLPNPVPDIPSALDHPREKILLAVGHLEPRKNFGDAIRAMAASGLEDEGWSLQIIGDGRDEEALRHLIAKFGLKGTSIHRPTQDIASWYARASLILVTSRVEVFSLVLAEAMQSGVVPVAYATDGPSFILEDFPEQLVEIGDVKALAERLRHFAGQRDLVPLREKLRRSIGDRFSPNLIIEQWRQLLQ